MTRHVYVVNKTKKEIRKFPFVAGFDGIGSRAKVAWNILTNCGFNLFDDIEYINDTHYYPDAYRTYRLVRTG